MIVKKDFVAIAKIMKLYHDGEIFDYKKKINMLADYFISVNPKFDKEKFMVACGVEE